MKKTKLTPEQIETNRLEREEEQRRAEIRRREAKERQKLEAETFLLGLKNKAAALKLPLPSSTDGLSAAELEVRKEIGAEWLSTQAALEEKAFEMTVRPSSVLEWNNVQELAATREILDGMVVDIADGQMAETVIAHYESALRRSILDNRWSGGSSSAAHNAMDHVRTEVVARFLRNSLSTWKGMFEWDRKAQVKAKYQIS